MSLTIHVPGTPWNVSPTVSVPDWAGSPLTNWIDTSVPGTLDRINLPDVQQPADKPPVGFQGSDPQRARYAEQVKADYAAMQTHMIGDNNGRLEARQYSQDGNQQADSWPFGQLTAAALDRALVTGDTAEAQKALNGLDRYMRSDATFSPHVGANAGRFTDDNAWIGLDEVQAFKMTGQQKYIDGARKVYDYLASMTDANGKIFWSDSKDSYNTCSAGPARQLALQLYQLTGDQKYKDGADKYEKFLNSMQRPDGLLGDNVKPDGTVDDAPRSYNQGVAIGADVQDYEITHDPAKLQQAKDLANRALDYYAQDDRLWKEDPAFNAIFFRNLMQLDRVAPDPRYRATLERYLERANQSRDSNGLYSGNGIPRYDGKPEQGTPLIDQSAFVQMNALLAMTPEQLKAVS